MVKRGVNASETLLVGSSDLRLSKERKLVLDTTTPTQAAARSPLSLSEDAPRAVWPQYSVVRLLELPDAQFVCEIEVNASVSAGPGPDDITLTCTARSYPKSHIGWTRGFKALSRLGDYHSITWSSSAAAASNVGPNSTPEARSSSDVYSLAGYAPQAVSYTLHSQLVLTYAANLTLAYETYYCRVNYQTQPPAPLTAAPTAKPLHARKDFLFRVNPHLYSRAHQDAAAVGDHLQHFAAAAIGDRRLLSGGNGDSRNVLNLLLAVACFLLALTVVLSAVVCVLVARRRHKQVCRRRREAKYASSSSYSSSTCASSSYSKYGGRGGDRYVHQPLKPDVIREHQETSSIYVNLNHTAAAAAAASRYGHNAAASPYTQMLFHSPSSPQQESASSTSTSSSSAPAQRFGNFNRRSIDINNNNININSTYANMSGGGDLSDKRFRAIMTSTTVADVSCDMSPVESTLIEHQQPTVAVAGSSGSGSTTSGSKSFDENIDEYMEDPKFDEILAIPKRNSNSNDPNDPYERRHHL